jgi:hypothetical protein
MSNQTEKVFAQGLIAKRRDGAPDFVTCSLSVKVDEFKEFLDTHAANGWVNLNVKKSQGGKYYAELDTWKPNKEANQDAPQASTAEAEPEGDLPF